MNVMHRFIYKFSIFVAIIALISALLSGVSVMTTFIRTGLVFLGTILLFVILLNVMRWAIETTTIIDKHNEEEKQNEEEVQEQKKNLTKRMTDILDEPNPEKS
jgi:uncharacterized membrane protein